MSIRILSFLLCLISLGIHPLHAQKKKKRKSAYKRPRVYVIDSTRYLKPYDWTSGDSLWQDTVLAVGNRCLGIPYRYGGSDARGFDCSGFVMYCYKQVGYRLPHEAGAQMRAGIPIKKDSAHKGDLIFFGYRGKRGWYISHSGIVASNENGNLIFLHSASNIGIRYDSLNSPWYRQRFMGIRRYIKTSELQ